MTLGGVFERHPNLRYGVIEVGAHWVPHLAQKIDLWYHQFHSRWDSMMLPSEYIARNVRVTPFYFEPVADYIDANPRLASVYCFSSDFPHREGGKACHEIFAKELERLGDDISEQFFRTNPELLLPA